LEINEPHITQKITLTDIYNTQRELSKTIEQLTQEVSKQNHLRRDIDSVMFNCEKNLHSEDGPFHKLAASIKELKDEQIQYRNRVEGKKLVESGILRWGVFAFGATGWVATLISLFR